MTDENSGIIDPDRLGARLGAQNEDETHEFEEVAAQLALAAEPVQPPAALKESLFARLGTTPQLPAQGAPEAVAEPAEPVHPASTSAEERARRRWFQRPGAILAAAAAAVILFIGGAFVGVGLAGTDSFQHQQASALAALNAAPDVQRSSAAVTGGGSATLVWSAQLGTSALVATDLPKLADDKTYELWYIRDGVPAPAGTMDSAGAAATWRVLSGEMTAGTTVAMTVEPDGGSTKPTTKPIVAITS